MVISKLIAQTLVELLSRIVRSEHKYHSNWVCTTLQSSNKKRHGRKTQRQRMSDWECLHPVSFCIPLHAPTQRQSADLLSMGELNEESALNNMTLKLMSIDQQASN